MIANFDDFNRLKQPSLILTNPEEIPISYVDEAYIKNFIFKPKFNDISEITFDIYEHSFNGEIFKGYKKLIQRMRITVEGYGSWIISEVVEKKSNVGDANYKSITLKSTEYEIQNIQIPYIDGTYKLYDIAEYEKSLLGTTLSKIPKWTIEHVDFTIASLYRTFEVPDSNVLSFLLNDVQDAYGCLFIFDCAKRKISVYDRDTYVRYSGILLTNDELIDSMEITRSDENLITALSVFGDSDLGINAVNPLGTSSIYNFSQVKQWMTPELLTKVNTWEKEVSNAEGTVKNKNIELSKLNAELTSINTQVSSQEQTVKGLKAERDVIVSKNNQTELDSINSQISTAESQLSTYKTNQINKQNQITQKQNELSTIQTKLSPANYFSDLYYNFLSYVYENEYTNDNIAITDSMTYEERINEIQTLYNAAKDVLLQKVNIPNEYSVDTKGFVFNKRFLNHTQGLEVGNLIGAETEGSNDGKIEYFPVLEFEVNYEDKSVKITFGNKFNPTRAKDLFADLMHDVSSTGKILDYITAKKADTSEISDMQKFINSTLDLSKNAILSANGQTVEITDSGYHGRRLLPDGSLDKKEVAIINNTIAFTIDNWRTCSLAVGELTLANGNSVYGIIADVLIGKLLMGENLYISNSSGTYTIDENGFIAISSKTPICKIAITPNDSNKLFYLSKNNEDIMRFDSSGNVFIKGSIFATSLTITNDAMDADTKNVISGCITADTIKSLNLEVGNEIKMGKNATISWNKVTGTSNVANKSDIPNDEYITTITKNSITSEYIKALNLEVGNQIKMGENATISWSKVTGTSNVANKSDIPNDEYITTITKNTINTEYVSALRATAGALAIANGSGGWNVIANTGGLWVIGNGTAENPVFRVDNTGYMFSQSGKIGNWSIGSGTIANNGTVLGANGSLTIANGKIGNWSIGSGAIANNGVVLSGDGKLILAGNNNEIQLGGNARLIPAALFVKQGSVNGSVPWYAVFNAATRYLSDERIKCDITPISNEIYENLFDCLQAYTFKFKNDSYFRNGKLHMGFIAQRIKENIDKCGLSNLSLYVDDNPELLGVDKEELIALCVWQIQKLKARINELERRRNVTDN